jgi:hypothetical protein
VKLTLSTTIVAAQMDSVQTSKHDEDDEMVEEREVVVLFGGTIALCALLRFTASDYPFDIFKHFLH